VKAVAAKAGPGKLGVAVADGFLGRWSRRKLDAKEGQLPETEPLPPKPADASVNAAPAPVAAPDAKGPDAGLTVGEAPAAPEPPPTMDDVRALTPDSDFSRYTGSQVAPEVKNAAMKKLFADPHFNVMDGLDIYIDDYGKPDPIPESMLRNLASAQFLGLFREDKPEGTKENPEAPGTKPGDSPRAGAPEIVAQSGPPEPLPDPANEAAARAPDADPDLRLQQDPAPGSQGPGQGDR
jgi:hypothetical protein